MENDNLVYWIETGILLTAAAGIGAACLFGPHDRAADPAPERVTRASHNGGTFRTTEFEGHLYVTWIDRRGTTVGGVLHSPACPCLNNKGDSK